MSQGGFKEPVISPKERDEWTKLLEHSKESGLLAAIVNRINVFERSPAKLSTVVGMDNAKSVFVDILNSIEFPLQPDDPNFTESSCTTVLLFGPPVRA